MDLHDEFDEFYYIQEAKLTHLKRVALDLEDKIWSCDQTVCLHVQYYKESLRKVTTEIQIYGIPTEKGEHNHGIAWHQYAGKVN